MGSWVVQMRLPGGWGEEEKMGLGSCPAVRQLVDWWIVEQDILKGGLLVCELQVHLLNASGWGWKLEKEGCDIVLQGYSQPFIGESLVKIHQYELVLFKEGVS